MNMAKLKVGGNAEHISNLIPLRPHIFLEILFKGSCVTLHMLVIRCLCDHNHELVWLVALISV